MKKYLYLFLTAVCVWGFAPQDASGRQGTEVFSLHSSSLSTDIPEETLHYVLTQAAPQFGFLPSQFIRLYYDCTCIVVFQSGPNKYRVEYGGLGIEILVDALFVTQNISHRPRNVKKLKF